MARGVGEVVQRTVTLLLLSTLFFGGMANGREGMLVLFLGYSFGCIYEFFLMQQGTYQQDVRQEQGVATQATQGNTTTKNNKENSCGGVRWQTLIVYTATFASAFRCYLVYDQIDKYPAILQVGSI